jgi:AraC-like DNA-binding protein
MAEQFAHFAPEPGAGNAFALYRDLYSGGVDVHPYGDGFSAEVNAWRLAGIILFDRRLMGVAHERTPERIRQDGFDHFTVQLLVEGAFEIDSGAGYVALRPGQIMLLDMTRPVRNRTPGGHVVTASVSRDVVHAALGSTANQHGRLIGHDNALLLADYMKSLTVRATEIAEANLSAVSRAFIDLLTVAAEDVDIGRGVDLRRLEFARRESAKRFIESNLHGELTAETISEATGVSRATLYRIFQEDGGVGRVIQARRLVRLRAALTDPTNDRPLADIAHDCGFKSESHMSKLFREAFATTPGEYRRQLRAAHTDRAKMAIARDRWASWVGEVL